MQILNLEIGVWSCCILLSIFQIILIVIHQKFQNKFQFKIYSCIFFGNLILLSGFLITLLTISLSLIVIIFEIIELIFLQINLLIYRKIIWRQPINIYLFFFSIFLFGILHTVGKYLFYREIIEEHFFKSISFYTLISFECITILIMVLFSIFVIFLFIRIFSRVSIYSSIFTRVWGCLFVFGIPPFLNMLFYELGIPCYIIFGIWEPLGEEVGTLFIGDICLYLFLMIYLLVMGVIYGRKYGFKFLSNKSLKLSHSLKRYMGIGLVIGGIFLLEICFFYFIQITIPIAPQITQMMNLPFNYLTHPTLLVGIIYQILLLIGIYIGFQIYIIIKNKQNLWKEPNEFNKIPVLNLSILIFSGFLVCYYELVPDTSHILYLNRLFILFVAYFILTIYLFFLLLYIFSFQRKQWQDLPYALKTFIFYVPFILGVFIGGQILTPTEILLGLMGLAALQIYILYLRKIPFIPNNISQKHLNWFICIFWAILASCFIGLISITGLISMVISLILIYAILNFVEHLKKRIFLYGILLGNILIIGGTSLTFHSSSFAISVPNINVIYIFFIIILCSVFFAFFYRFFKIALETNK